MISLPLEIGIDSLPGVGDKRAGLLANLSISTVGDLLAHLPRAYEDRRLPKTIESLAEGDTATIEAEVVRTKAVRLRRRLNLAEVTLRDATGTMKAIWFGQDFLARSFKPGQRGFFTGTVGKWSGLALRNPDYEMMTGDEEDRLNSGRIVPVYRLTDGISQRMLRRLMRAALDSIEGPLVDPLPQPIRDRHGFPSLGDALRAVHFPADLEEGGKSRARLAYEELLAIQLGVLMARRLRRAEIKHIRHIVDGPALAAFRASLSFELTRAQHRAVSDILHDLSSDRPMMRLLQGDVGCGKTAVALHAMVAAADGGYQTALMAPTEILAEQHAISLHVALAPLGIGVEALTGTTPNAGAVRERVANGSCHVIVGTHALIQQSVSFRRLGLVVIDEQHRFGVVQRNTLALKGECPDVLQMTATPIPRTLAMTVYGGMDITVIDELPPGRKPIKTRCIPDAKVHELYGWIHERADSGFQAYVVCPLVEESAARDAKAVTSHFEELSGGPLSGLRVGLLHGRLASNEKAAVMQAFKRGEIDVLFSTSVIEVGIDCPNAVAMVIEDASQFGLTQLHQLRGRIGRGSEQSHCFLLGKPKTPEGKKRLDVFCKCASGFDIAEADLEMRGPGEFSGVRQAGLSDLRAADLIRDARLLDSARRDAESILESDPALADPIHAPLLPLARRYMDVSR